MRRAAPVAAVALLVVIGLVEASVSAAQLAEAAGPLRLGGPGLLLSGMGFLASAAVYLAVGHLSRDERAAVRTGALIGLAAGAVGGTLRALLVREALEALVWRYAAVPTWFIVGTLVVFVVLCAATSAIGGAAIAWTGQRLSRAARTRPPA